MKGELNIEDLDAILQWHSKAYENQEDPISHKSTLIKIKAMMIYALEEEDRQTRFMNRRMRCKICSIPHKNTSRFQLWEDVQVCRLCSSICDYFSWNGNYLHEYWRNGN